MLSFLLTYLELKNKKKSDESGSKAHKSLIRNRGLILEANGGEGCCGFIIDVVVQVGALWFPPGRSLTLCDPECV